MKEEMQAEETKTEKTYTTEDLQGMALPADFKYGMIEGMKMCGKATVTQAELDNAEAEFKEMLAKQAEEELQRENEDAFIADWEELFKKHPTFKAMITYRQEGKKGIGNSMSPTIETEHLGMYRAGFVHLLNNKR